MAQGTTAVVALLANILASRSLLADGRGELALLLQLAYLGTLGVSLGTDRSIVAVYGGSPVHEVVRAQVRLLVRPALAALCLGLLSEIALPLLGLGEWRVAGIIVALFVVSNAFVRASRAVAIAGNRQRDFLVATIAEQLLLLAALAGLALAGVYSVVVWVAAYLLTCHRPCRVLPRAVAEERPSPRGGRRLTPSCRAPRGPPARAVVRGEHGHASCGPPAPGGDRLDGGAGPLRGGQSRSPSCSPGRCSPSRTTERASGDVDTTQAVCALARSCWGRRRSSRSGRCHCGAHLVHGAPAGSWLRGRHAAHPSSGGGCRRARHVPGRHGVAHRATPQHLGLGQRHRGFVISLIAYVSLIPGHGAAGAAWGSLIGYGAALTIGTAALLGPGRVRVAAGARRRGPRRTSASPAPTGSLPATGLRS